MTELEKVNKFVENLGYLFAKKLPKKHKGLSVYIPYGHLEIGFPVLIVVDEKGKISEDYDLWKEIDIDDFEPKFTKEESSLLSIDYKM